MKISITIQTTTWSISLGWSNLDTVAIKPKSARIETNTAYQVKRSWLGFFIHKNGAL